MVGMSCILDVACMLMSSKIESISRGCDIGISPWEFDLNFMDG